jgi:hypothetical protein
MKARRHESDKNKKRLLTRGNVNVEICRIKLGQYGFEMMIDSGPIFKVGCPD